MNPPTASIPPALPEYANWVRKLADSGKTIILASHLLDEVEKACTHVAILRSGKLLLSGPVNTVISRNDFVRAGSGKMNTLLQAAMLQSAPAAPAPSCKANIVRASFAESPDAAAINSYCAQQGTGSSYLQLRQKSL